MSARPLTTDWRALPGDLRFELRTTTERFDRTMLDDVEGQR
ncbi:hypothetical protein [Halomarina litorea]|nr:hypothetical protein [Halomarina sp. BCD28]